MKISDGGSTSGPAELHPPTGQTATAQPRRNPNRQRIDNLPRTKSLHAACQAGSPASLGFGVIAMCIDCARGDRGAQSMRRMASDPIGPLSPSDSARQIVHSNALSASCARRHHISHRAIQRFSRVRWAKRATPMSLLRHHDASGLGLEVHVGGALDRHAHTVDLAPFERTRSLVEGADRVAAVVADAQTVSG